MGKFSWLVYGLCLLLSLLVVCCCVLFEQIDAREE